MVEQTKKKKKETVRLEKRFEVRSIGIGNFAFITIVVVLNLEDTREKKTTIYCFFFIKVIEHTRCLCARYCNKPPARRNKAGAKRTRGDVYK